MSALKDLLMAAFRMTLTSLLVSPSFSGADQVFVFPDRTMKQLFVTR